MMPIADAALRTYRQRHMRRRLAEKVLRKLGCSRKAATKYARFVP